MSKPADKSAQQPIPTDPVDVIDGVPDRTPNPALWKKLLIAAIFIAWMAFLIYCAAV